MAVRTDCDDQGDRLLNMILELITVLKMSHEKYFVEGRIYDGVVISCHFHYGQDNGQCGLITHSVHADPDKITVDQFVRHIANGILDTLNEKQSPQDNSQPRH